MLSFNYLIIKLLNNWHNFDIRNYVKICENGICLNLPVG